MRRLTIFTIVTILFAGFCLAQPTPPIPQYFAETGFGGDFNSLTSTTGFGLRIGASQFWWVTDVDTSLRPLVTSSSTIRTGAEYHAAISGNMEFLGYAAAGVTVDSITTIATQNTSPTSNVVASVQASTNTVGLGSFQGGFGLSYDIGKVVSKGKFSLPIVPQFRITAISGDQVKTAYFLMFRKTF